ncbi:MAG: hypothetical protein KF900_12665 [Bacteroidetes bacterium]|nr:hypothetical protein [Bacteroidota bacterium]
MKTYKLKNAATLSVDGSKYNLIASPATALELKQHKEHFMFDFIQLSKQNIVYKLCIENQENVIQGLVAFKAEIGVLRCENMEVNEFNRKRFPLYNGVGKAMVALCCKYSSDNGMDGYIGFIAKNRLLRYYSMFGAKILFGTNMYIDSVGAKKLIDLYF